MQKIKCNMTIKHIIHLAVTQPRLISVFFKRILPVQQLRHDPECAHLIKSWSNGRLTRKSALEIFPQIKDVDVVLKQPYSRVIGTAIDLPEVAVVAAIIKAYRSRNILEIGTNDGFSSLNWAANLCDGDSSLQTVDLPVDHSPAERTQIAANACDPEAVGRLFRDTPEAARIKQVFGDSRALDWTSLGAPFDMIFIDGCHEYEFVRSDSLNALHNISPGGVIFWHDYGLIPDVSAAVDELVTEGPIFAIKGTRMAAYRKPSTAVNQ
jgi:predicted O-methyltransferase YrrM